VLVVLFPVNTSGVPSLLRTSSTACPPVTLAYVALVKLLATNIGVLEKESVGKPPLRSPYWMFASRLPFRTPGFWLLKDAIASLLGARKVKLLLLASKAVALEEPLTRLLRELS
jgi:hypothetical protein